VRAGNFQEQIAASARLEQQFRGQEALLRELTENIHQVFWLASANYRQVFYVSPSYEDTWGRSCESLLRNPMSWLEAIHPDDRPGIEAQLARNRGQRSTREYRIVRPDSAVRWILARGYPVRDKRGRPCRIAGLAEDITERKQAEAKIQQLAAIVQSSDDAIVSKDLDGRILTWNRAAERIFGYRAKEVIGQNVMLLIPENLKADETAILEKLRKGERIQNDESIRLKKDETPLPVSLTISPFRDASGKIVGASTIMRDLGERQRAEKVLKESERRYTSLFKNMVEGFMYCRMLFEDGQPQDFIVLEVNQAFEKLTGLRNVIGRKASEFVPGIREADPELFERYGRVALTGQPQRFEFCISKLKRWFSVSAYCPKKEEFIAVFNDMTERKRAEEDLRVSQEQLRALAARLQAAREEERTWVAREIHDVLAQDLTRLKVDVTLLTRLFAQSSGKSEQSLIRDKLAGMAIALDTSIQSVQKITTDLRPMVLDSLGLCAAIEWQVKDFQARTGIRCEARLPSKDLPLDRNHSTALFRILQESLTNVVRHAAATHVKVRLQYKAEYVALTIHDNGRGIQESQTEAPGALGLLGLRERAQLCGGRCDISSRAGEGTRVEARLPLPPKRNSEEKQL
jgi:PAS domain S-box-containing protein